MSNELRPRIEADMKTALKGGDKDRLGTIRLAIAAIKQREIDERVTLDDAGILAVLDKMIKQRRESIAQFASAGRDDLVRKEQAEVDVLTGYLPAALSEAEVTQLIRDAIAQTGASGVRDMGKVMALVKPAAQGRADMGQVSNQIKALLS